MPVSSPGIRSCRTSLSRYPAAWMRATNSCNSASEATSCTLAWPSKLTPCHAVGAVALRISGNGPGA